MSIKSRLSHIVLVAATTACATAGATYQSGVAPKTFDRPPFYAGVAASTGPSRVAHLAVRYQRGAEQAALFEPKGGSGSPAAALVADMNAFLDSLGATARVAPASEPGTAPNVRFGCAVDAAGDCTEEGEVAGNGSNRRLELSVGRPSQEWIDWLGGALGTSSDHALVITLELGQYWPKQKGLSLSKEVQLGTGYSVGVPWLTSLEKPVAVVQLTGALVGRDGRAVRIGAEGMMAKRTNIGLSALGAQMLVTDDDIAQLRTLRREDLPGQPLVWQVALRTLVSQLTGRTDLGLALGAGHSFSEYRSEPHHQPNL
ncbi:MAG TPA: hypothetical protein VM076_12075 [Gemmatimonadaceae bacterium]|nr:hypothetical protein [Gemmatimonadaceae bacterium]